MSNIHMGTKTASHPAAWPDTCPACLAWTDEQDNVWCTTPHPVYLIGRHAADLPGTVQVMATEAINWPIELDECIARIAMAEKSAIASGARFMLVQNVPGILAAALNANAVHLPWYVVISKPGQRMAGVKQEYNCIDEGDANLLAGAVSAANPNAKVAVVGFNVYVTVDPPMKFEFAGFEMIKEATL